jgi:hypothetical protein
MEVNRVHSMAIHPLRKSKQRYVGISFETRAALRLKYCSLLLKLFNIK